MKNLIILLVVLFLTLIINAQSTPPSIQWQKCFGGSYNDYAYSIKQTSDGGFIIAGNTYSHDGNVTNNHDTIFFTSDYWIIKLDTLGNMQWQKCLGSSYYDYAYSLQQTNDGGYIVSGGAGSNDGDVIGNHGNGDYWIIKLDTSGNIQWQKCLGGYNADCATTIQQTKDGGYIVSGYTRSNNGDVTGFHGDYDYWIVKLDTSGNLQWQKCLGGTNDDEAPSIQQTHDGGYIIAGGSNSLDGDVTGNHGDYDYWIVKLDTSGNLIWQKCLGGSRRDVAISISQTSDMGYIIAGYTNSNDGNVTGNHDTTGNYSDYWIVKLDTSGNIQWQRCLGGSQNEDVAVSIQQTNDNGYIIAGGTFSNDGNVTGNHGAYDTWIVKLDTSGNVQWQNCLGGTKNDEALSIQQTNDGGFIVAGFSCSNDGNVSGNHDTTGNYSDFWIVKLGPAPLGIKEQENSSDISIYPNPSTGKFIIQVLHKINFVKIINSLGQVVEERYINNQDELNFEIKTNGFYFVQIITDKEIIIRKIIVVK